MANDLNNCSFIGRLGQDPEIRAFPDGGSVCNVNIACGSSWTDKQTGEKKERTEWIPLVFKNRMAEIVGQYLSKGSMIYVSGEYRTRKWQDKDGQDRYTTEIHVTKMQMLGGNSGSNNGSNQGYQQPTGSRQPQVYQQPVAQQPTSASGFDNSFDDDIPF